MSQTEEPRESVPPKSGKQPLSPGLKSWLDNVIAPALVKQCWPPQRHGVNSGAKPHDAESETVKLRSEMIPE